MVADALSRDNDRSDKELTHIFRTHRPSQIPQHFEIQPLPNKIISWLTALLLKLPLNLQYNEKHTRTKLGCGTDGQPTAVGLDSETHSSPTSPALQTSSSSVPLPWLCAKQDFQDHLMTDWLMDQLQVPSHMYVRPSGSTADPIRPSMMMENLDSFYNENSDLSKRPTQEKHQKAIPISIISTLAKQQLSELDRAIIQLTGLDIFFAFRSCEYLDVPYAEHGQTEILRLRNIWFFKDGELVQHSHPELEFADCVSLTFERQKHKEKNDTVTQEASGDSVLCPVQFAAGLV